MHTRTARSVILVPAGAKASTIELGQIEAALDELLTDAPKGARRTSAPRLIGRADTAKMSVIPIGQHALMYEADFTFPN